jgi:glycosyltransferase involved in cell wall biosynthesis
METKQPFFSVIIPTTGGRLENLELVLTSLANQWFPKSMYEVIVVNDGGEKEAEKILYQFSESLRRRVYLYSERFIPLDFDKSLSDVREVSYTGWTDGGDCEGMVPDIQPRNKGALFARGDFFIFADSDIILCPTALACYFQDMIENPNRVVLGVYHWLYPMHVTPEDITTRFDAIIEERLAKKLLDEVEPSGKQTHNIMRDYRMPLFEEYGPDVVFTQPGHLNIALSCFSGNICWPRAIFEDIGGYTPYLHAGAHEDGFSGIDIYKRGHGISFDKRIVGGHLYHHRNVEMVESWKWERGEIPWLNEQHADCPEMTDIIEMTKREMESLGVADWKEKGKMGW